MFHNLVSSLGELESFAYKCGNSMEMTVCEPCAVMMETAREQLLSFTDKECPELHEGDLILI